MKAVISSTYSDTYLFFIPIVTFCWNKLGVGVICFIPESKKGAEENKMNLISETLIKNGADCLFYPFKAPEHKEATYAQCSRLYAAALPNLNESDTLITGDCDMAYFSKNYIQDAVPDIIDVYGVDLVPDGQFPICYLSGYVKTWREIIGEGTYQQHLDNLLGDIECENMRGNYWSKDQQAIWELLTKAANLTSNIDFITHKRARPNTQFADNRVDRDDINWRAYVNDELVDAHLWRNGFTDGNFANIMELLKMKYPNDDFNWLVEYCEKYKSML